MDRRNGDLGPLDAELDARRCLADGDPRHGEEMCFVAGGLATWCVGEVAAPHFLSLYQSFRELPALASDDLDDITDGLDDMVALEDHLSLTGKRGALLDVNITIQAIDCWHDRLEERISNAAAYAELGLCFHRCTTVLDSAFTSD